MFRKDRESYYIEEFRELGIEALYTGNDFNYGEFEKNREMVHGYQTHSKNIQVISKKSDIKESPYPECDGFITDRKEITLYTKHADCLAIYFYDRKKEIIGICHSGWKGSYEKIVLEMIEGFKNHYNSQLEDMLVGIGIGIAPENYEVSKEFFENFQERYSERVLKEVFHNKSEKIFFNNESFNYNLLIDYGVSKENIICSNLCTFSDATLHSHRRDREKAGRNRAYIYFNKG